MAANPPQARPVDPWNENLNSSLRDVDPKLYSYVHQEMHRQHSCLELIASENFTSTAVMEANATALTNKYSEGLPNARYYGGNHVVDKIENLCRERALTAFSLDPAEWGVNVQPYSGSQANFAALTALLAPHDRIMGLDLPSGGHLTHGYQTPKRKISASAIYFESMGYKVDHATGIVDYDKLAEQALMFRPKLIICGASAYARDWEYERLRTIADSVGAFLMADIAHISGLIAATEQRNPFEFADIVTTTTHKTLRGPRAGLIFFSRKNKSANLETRVNNAVFPANQGGPHNHCIAAIAVALLLVAKPSFKQYAIQIRRNASALAESLVALGHKIVTGGTDNHIVLWDLRPHEGNVLGNKLEHVCDLVSITLNKNTIHGDKSAFCPGGVRIGTPALTSRSFHEDDFRMVAGFLHRAFIIAQRASIKCPEWADFTKYLLSDVPTCAEIAALKSEVETFARAFPMPGFNSSSIDVEAVKMAEAEDAKN